MWGSGFRVWGYSPRIMEDEMENDMEAGFLEGLMVIFTNIMVPDPLDKYIVG